MHFSPSRIGTEKHTDNMTLSFVCAILCSTWSFLAQANEKVSVYSNENVIVPSNRTSPMKRKFNSSLVNHKIQTLQRQQPWMKDPRVATLFSNCFPNTLDTTVVRATFNDSFVITGDIDAMWLRDSTNQVLPYVSLVAEEVRLLRLSTPTKSPPLNSPELVRLFTGLVRRQLRSVLIDSYANSYNMDANGHGHQIDERIPRMQPGIFEGKYELDSLCAVIKLSYQTWQALRGAPPSSTAQEGEKKNPYRLFEPSRDLAHRYFGKESTVVLWIKRPWTRS